MTNDEKLAIFERAGISDEFIDDTDRQIETGEFFEDSWITVETRIREANVMDVDSQSHITIECMGKVSARTGEKSFEDDVEALLRNAGWRTGVPTALRW